MTTSMVGRVRSFNRTVTERVGALDEQYLGLDRPLGEARLLWEIGGEGAEVRHLRRRLGMDSGYASRLLRSLEAQGLIVVTAAADDKRVRLVRLTAQGATERAELDRLSDELALAILEPLDERHRERLVAAMAEVERLLLTSLITIDAEDPRTSDAQRCIQRYFAEIADRFEQGFEEALSLPTAPEDFSPPAGLFLIARRRGQPVGCGALKLRPGEPAELKRMWVAPEARGAGLGRRLLLALEQRAMQAGATALRLETNRALGEAIGLYRRAGYAEIAAFNSEPYAHHWFEKQLG